MGEPADSDAAAFEFVMAYQRARHAFDLAAADLSRREGVEALKHAYHAMLHTYVHMRPGEEPSVVGYGSAADPDKTQLIAVERKRGGIGVLTWEDVSKPLIPPYRYRYVLRQVDGQLKIHRLYMDARGRWMRIQP